METGRRDLPPSTPTHPAPAARSPADGHQIPSTTHSRRSSPCRRCSTRSCGTTHCHRRDLPPRAPPPASRMASPPPPSGRAPAPAAAPPRAGPPHPGVVSAVAAAAAARVRPWLHRRPQLRPHLRHHAPRRGAVPGHHHDQRREARRRTPARPPRRRHHRGRLPGLIPRRPRRRAMSTSSRWWQLPGRWWRTPAAWDALVYPLGSQVLLSLLANAVLAST